MKTRLFAWALLLAITLNVNAINTTTTVNAVSSTVTLSTNVDYVITGTTPFTGNGKVDITNTEHAVLIIQNIRPSVVISNHLKNRVYINGVQAVNGENCQVKMYAQGSIIMPYGKDFKPLTVYSEQNFGGTAVNDFGLEHSGGFMNTLSEEKLNNQIRSFKLKRGYMVTFATGKSGWGYSRCFIADKEDLEFAELPAVFDGRITSYRIFQWYDAQKKGLASDTRASANSLLGTSWCYDWAEGSTHLPDRECVPHQIYVAWPSAAACGSATYACHMKTNNEPGNSADDRPQDVETILNQWQELMRTGMRLCSESSHDGSWSHLDQFIAEIDKRGWRCDILDLHCYWASGFDNMQYYYEKYGNRPIWISEFVWGASWNNNGIFATDRSFSTANQQKNLDAMKGILTSLNNSPYVERYAYWNGEADCSKLIRGESEMSLTGNYYRDMNSGLAYRKEYEKIPNVVYSAPTNVTGAWVNLEKRICKLFWEDANYDLLKEMQVQRRKVGATRYTTVGIVKPIDQDGKNKRSCTYQDTITGTGEYEYRIVNITAENAQYPSSPIKINSEIPYATVENGTYYLKNVESGLFMTQGSHWGTCSSFDEIGIDITFTQLPNGKYTLDTRVFNGSNHYLGVDGYVDAAIAEWALIEQQNNTYAFTIDEAKYLGYDGSSTVNIDLTDPTNASARWQLITKEERIEELYEATPDEPMNASFFISGGGFNKLDERVKSWSDAPGTGGYNAWEESNFCGEKWNTASFDVAQELKGLPNGNYILRAQGFYRMGGGGNNPDLAAQRHQSGTETLNAMLYANDESIPLMSIIEGAQRNKFTYGESISTTYGYVPQNMESAASAFSQGLYEHELPVTVTDGTLRIGVKKTVASSNDWTIFDNFRLYYYGTDETTGIPAMPVYKPQPTPIYDLIGRRVENPAKGIYIVNGKKVVIK